MINGYSPFHFRLAEFVICVRKHSHYRSKCFKRPKKTPAFSSQPRDIVPNIRIDAFRVVRVPFVARIAYMLPLKIHFKIRRIPVGRVTIRRHYALRYPLHLLRRFGLIHTSKPTICRGNRLIIVIK
jgi:hypothetical protein